MNGYEKFAAELCWGCIPLDKKWIKNQKCFVDMLNKVMNKEYDDLITYKINQIYTTKFATKEKVILKEIIYYNGKIHKFGVIYLKAKHLGICPLGSDRLIKRLN